MFRWLALILVLLPEAALAEDGEFCAQRPGQASAPCTLGDGETMVEVAAADWSLSKGGGVRATELALGGALVRHGLTDRTELQIGWTPLVTMKSRDSSGARNRTTATGDAAIGLQHKLREGRLALAANATVSLPVGGKAASAGDWGVAFNLPASVALGEIFGLDLTPGIEAAVDGDGKGRHLAYGGVAGISIAASDRIGLAFDISVIRDRDPAGASTSAQAGAAFALQLDDKTQIDFGGTLGLNRNRPDITIGLGLARRF